MSGIVLSASVRQNLLSLQSTADLLATTQNRLSTGKKVNSALDNPTNFFTAQGLDNRASDISNLLDGIGNGRHDAGSALFVQSNCEDGRSVEDNHFLDMDRVRSRLASARFSLRSRMRPLCAS